VIVEVTPGRKLGDRAYFAKKFHVAVITIRRHCTPVMVWKPTGHVLYDEGEVELALKHVRPRRKRVLPLSVGWRTA
jgi:hypothetical protein